jgi:hypothetical protein
LGLELPVLWRTQIGINTHVNAPLPKSGHLLGSLQFYHEHLHFRMQHAEQLQERGHHAGGKCRDVGHVESAPSPVGCLAGVPQGGFRCSQRAFGIREKGLSRVGQGDAAVAVALQQAHTHFLFQDFDLAAERRLAHAQPFGRRPEGEFLSDGDERA